MSFGPQHEEVDDGAGTGTFMTQANYAAKGPHTFTRWWNCQICGLSYPENEVVITEGGAAYCTRFDHDQEIGKPTAGEVKWGKE